MPRTLIFDPCPLPNGAVNREPLKELGDDDMIGGLARMVGARAARTADGRVIAHLGEELNTPNVFVYKDEAEAFRALREIGAQQQLLNRAIAAGRTAEATGEIRLPDARHTLDGHLPPMYEVLLERPAALDSLERWTTGEPRPQSEVSRGTAARAIIGWHKMVGHVDPVVPVKHILRSMGDAGREMATVLETNRNWDLRARGYVHNEYLKARDMLTPEEQMWKFHAWVESDRFPELLDPGYVDEVKRMTQGRAKITPIDPARFPVYEQVYNRLKQLSDYNYEMGGRVGLEMAKPEDRYRMWHRRYDFGALKFPKEHENLVQDMIDSGVTDDREVAARVLDNLGYGTSRDRIVRHEMAKIMARNPKMPYEAAHAQAATTVDRVLRKMQHRRSGHLEMERKTDWPGYIRDVRAWDIALQDGARRIVEAHNFGPNDELLKILKGRIASENDLWAEPLVQEILDFETGMRRVEMGEAVRFLMKMQGPKLGMSWLSNISGNFNTLIRFGLGPMLRGMQAMSREAVEEGFRPTKITEDVFASGASGGLRGVFDEPAHAMFFDAARELEERGAGYLWNGVRPSAVYGRLGEAADLWVRGTASPFNFIELFVNRNLAYHTGVAAMKRIEQRLANEVPGSRGFRRLQQEIAELGMDPDSTIRMIRQGDEAILGELRMQAGAAATYQTQFRGDLQNMPLLAQTAAGKMFLQFRTFAIAQSSFLMNELFAYKRGMPERTMRLLGVMATVMPAWGILLSKAREGMYGPTLTTKRIERLMNSDSGTDVVLGGLLAFGSSGSLGMAVDLLTTAALGNKFQLASFAIPISWGSFVNTMMGVYGYAHAIATDDPLEKQRARKALASEIGGSIGAMVYHHGAEKQGQNPF